MAMVLDEILRAALVRGASDVHLVVGRSPTVRMGTRMGTLDFPLVTAEGAMGMLGEVLPEERMRVFLERRDLDFSHEIAEAGRFRVNAHFQRGSVAMAFRVIQDRIRKLGELGLPEVVERLTYLPRGLVLVTGGTGSGKSTTLAGMIEAMNERYAKHIIMLEDPVEYVVRSKRCVVEQREVGTDVPTFGAGLRHVLRQDPDVIMVGEMRDLETTAAAISAAETGHLVLSTLHTSSAAQTIERVIDIYPSQQQNQIRSMLASTLQAVLCQELFARVGGEGMVPAVEVLLVTGAVRNLIRENRIYEIGNVIETSRAAGMQTMDLAIKQLVLNGSISREDGVARAHYPEKLERGLGVGGGS